jgi:hypothetical protein
LVIYDFWTFGGKCIMGMHIMGKRLTSNVFCDEAVCMCCITTIDFGGFQLWEFSGCLENVGFQRFSRFSSEFNGKN